MVDRKPWEPYVAVKSEIINGIPYVEARYLQECIKEIRRLKEELNDASYYNKTRYLTAIEREKFQRILNASLRQILDSTTIKTSAP